MKCRLGSLSFAIAVLLFGAVRADADILVVETGAQDVLRFTPAGVRTTFAAANPAILDVPIGISADPAGNVYVVNQGADAVTPPTNSVAKFSSTGTSLGFFVTTASATLNAPSDIAFDAAGNAYVTNNANYIEKFNSAGVPQASFGLANTNQPAGIGYNPINGLLYVVNSATSGLNANSILIYNPANLGAAPTIITPNGSGTLDGPQQLAFDQNGNVFVASFGTASGVPISRIIEYTSAGTFIQVIATTFSGAEGVAYDPTSNTLYASYLGGPPATGATGFIEKYTFNGVGFVDAGTLATGLNMPSYLLNVPSVVPEPGSVVLMGLGLVAVVGYRARKFRAA